MTERTKSQSIAMQGAITRHGCVHHTGDDQNAPESTHTWKLTLPYPVSANRYWRSFVPRGRKVAVVVRSAEANAYRRDVAVLAKLAGISEPLTGRVALGIALYPRRPKDWQRRAAESDTWADTVQCIDLGNCEKVMADALNGIAWIDDKQLWRITLQKREPDDAGPRIEVTIANIGLWFYVSHPGTSAAHPAL